MELVHGKALVVGLFMAIAFVEVGLGRFFGGDRDGDLKADILCAVVVPGVIFALVLAASGALFAFMFPELEGVASDWPIWALFIVLLVGDDLSQYAWHRLTHSVPPLYALHRSHHSAPYLSIRVVYRNSLIYYLVMPSLWIVGALLFLGFGAVYPFYLVAKMLVIMGAHSSVPWDAPLYRWGPTAKLMWVVERVISTPTTHAAHHGLHADDGVTHYKGNFGNFLFLWDVLFGTAHITRRRPADFGIEDMAELPPVQEVLWPWVATGDVS